MAYVERYILNTCGNNSGKAIKLVLLKNQDTTPTPINIAGTASPINIKYKDNGNDPISYVIGSECELNLISGIGFTADDLYSDNERDWRVDVYVSNVLYWAGYVLPERISKPYSYENYNIRLTATDGLGKTKDIPYSNGGILYRGFDTQKNILIKCFQTLGLNIDTSIFVNTFETQMDAFSSPLNQASINQDRFIDENNNPLSVYDVLESILIPYSSRLFQSKGQWIIETVLEKENTTLNGYKYNYLGTLIGSTSFTQNLTAGGSTHQMAIIEDSHIITTENALKDTTAYYQYGFIRNSLSNGNFDTLDGDFFLNWSRVSSDYAQVENTYVYDIDGNPILSGHRLFVLENNILSGDAVQSETISVRKGEKVTITFNTSVGVHSTLDGKDAVLKFKIIDDDGLYFTNNGWQTGAGTLDITTPSKDFNNDAQLTFYIDIDPRTADYNFSFSFGAWVDDFFGDIFSYFYSFDVKSEVNKLIKPAIGSYVKKTQFNAFTSHGETKVMIFGDDDNDLVTSRILIGGDPTVLWKRLGDSTFNTLLSIVADTELKLNGKPKLLFDGDFLTKETISMQSMISVTYLTNKFFIINGEFDLVNDTYHLRLLELISDEVGHETFYGIDNGNFKDSKGSSIGQIGGVTTGGGSSGTGSQSLQQVLNIGRIGDIMQITASLEIPTIEPDVIKNGNIWIGEGTTALPIAPTELSDLADIAFTTLVNNQVLTYNSTSGKWENKTGSGGGVTSVSSANTDISVANGSTTPTLTLNSGVGANKIAKFDGSGRLLLYSTTEHITGGSGAVDYGTTSSHNFNVSGSNKASINGSGILVNAGGLNINNTTGRIQASGMSTALTAPGKSGTIKMVVTDANGALSWSDIPSGGVTSVAVTVPTGLDVSGSPITSSGTIAIALQSGYSIPTTANQTNWSTAYAHSQTTNSNPHATTLQQILTTSNTGTSMKITSSMEIPTTAPGTINTGNIWVGSGSTASSVKKTKVSGLTDDTTTAISIGTSQAGTYIVATNSSGITATIGSGLALSSVFVRQGGSGKVTFSGSGVTVLVKSTKQARTEGQNAVVEIFYETATRVVITGDLDNI